MPSRHISERRDRRVVVESWRVDEWQPLNRAPAHLSEHETPVLLANMKALEAYIEGKSAREILEESRLSIHVARRLGDRGARRHPITKARYGWHVCDPTFRLDEGSLPPHDGQERNSADDDADEKLMASNRGRGALRRLLNRVPGIRDKLDAAILKCDFDEPEKRVNPTVRMVHDYFLRTCRKSGVKDTEYPFNADYKGYQAIREYRERLLRMNTRTAANIIGGSELRAKASHEQSRSTAKELSPRCLPMERCEVDTWLADMMLKAFYEQNPELAKLLQPLRPNIYVAADRGSNAILALLPYFTAASAATRAVLRAILLPHKRRTIPGYAYPDEPCCPQELPELLWHVPLYLAMDLASHQKQLQVDAAARTLGLKVRMPSRSHTPRERIGAEGIAGDLTSATQHWVIGTGNSPVSPYRREPEAFAVHYAVARLLDFCEMYMAAHNLAKGSDGSSPMGRIRQALAEGRCVQVPMRENLRPIAEELLSPAFPAGIHHNVGGVPYVEKEHGRYFAEYGTDDYATLEWLGSQRAKNLQLHILEDASRAALFQRKGDQLMRLCGLKVMHRTWGRPHALMERQIYERLRDRGKNATDHMPSAAAGLLNVLRGDGGASLGLTPYDLQRELAQLMMTTRGEEGATRFFEGTPEDNGHSDPHAPLEGGSEEPGKEDGDGYDIDED